MKNWSFANILFTVFVVEKNLKKPDAESSGFCKKNSGFCKKNLIFMMKAQFD